MSRQKIIQSSITILFLGLLAGVYIYEQSGASINAFVDHDKAMSRYGFYLQEVSEASGVVFTHQAPQLDSKLNHIMPQIASMGASVSVVDLNNDGWQDFYLTNSKRGTQNLLYQNKGDGTFKDVAVDLGVADLNTKKAGASMGSVWGDFNNDGYEDLFVYRWGQPALFRNDAGAGFTEVTADSEFPKWVNANSAIWFDYDCDGYLDLFLAGYFDEDIDLWDIKNTLIMPESFEYATNGGRKYLFHNNGDGTFKEVSKQMGIVSNRWALSSSAADLTGNGYPDLIIANDYGVDELFINREGQEFIESGEQAGMGFAPKSGMNVSYGDILNQGKMAVYITNISEPGVLMQGNNLWVPRGGSTDEIGFQNLAGNIGAELGGWSYGAQFGDLNNDGFLDLYVANGFISGKKNSNYWYDFSMVTGGNRAIISDAKNWPSMEGRSLSGYQQNKVWVNDGAGKFREVGGTVGGALKLDSRAVAYADLWNRGTLDIIVTSQDGPVKIYKTHANSKNHWIGFKLIGSKSNKSAIGAEVELFWNGKRQLQVVSGGSGFSAQNQRPVHFGIGKNTTVDSVKIKWPSGKQKMINISAVDSTYIINEN